MALLLSHRARRGPQLLAASALALGIAGTALAADLAGTLDVPSGYGDADADPPKLLAPYWDEWNGFIEPKPPGFDPAQRLAVVLQGRGPDEPVGCGYALRGGDLAPATVVARVGTTLRIENTDGCAHELFAEGLDGFGPLQTAPGNARTLQVNETGSWTIRDRLYPHVDGHLHVVADLVACAEVDAQGRYRFKDVPAGSYRLTVYDGQRKVTEQTVEIGDGRDQTIDPIALKAQSK